MATLTLTAMVHQEDALFNRLFLTVFEAAVVETAYA